MTANVEEDKIFRINNRLCHFSSNGAYLAIAFQTNLLIKDAKTFETRQSFVFVDVIQHMEWSLNSEYILCANTKKAIVQVYSVHHPQWKCKLTEGSAGLQSVAWSPDSKCIITVADFNIQISIWNLEDQTVSHIQNLKTSAFNKLHFNPDGKKLAVVVTENGQDKVEIYKTDNWKISRQLICERLHSIDGIRWSPNNELLCIWCSSPAEPKLLIYSLVLEKPVVAFAPLEITSETWNKKLKGIENVKWSPSGQLLAVIGFNEVIVLLNYITWKPLLQLYLDPVIREYNYLTKVFKEMSVQGADSERTSNKRFASCEERVVNEIHERPINVEIGTKDDNDKFSIAKVKLFEFSNCGQFLALKHELYPTTLWIWNIFTNYLYYLLLENPITAVKWNPVHPQLLVFSECTRVYEWTQKKGVKPVPICKNMTVVDAYWHPTGERVALCGYNKAMIHEITNT